MTALGGEILIAGRGAGTVLRIDHPISFWGGVDPRTARISDPRHPRHGERLAGRVVAIRSLRGSSSSSAVLLELIHAGIAPAAILLRETDAILALGALVAREMGYGELPMVKIDEAAFAAIAEGRHARIDGAEIVLD